MSHVIFLGRNVSRPCQECGLFERSLRGHASCSMLACPVGLKEFTRRLSRPTRSRELVAES